MGEEIKNILTAQYDAVLYSRNTLFEYLNTIRTEDFITENSSFGRGSIRNLLVHICDTYAAWIGMRALNINLDFKPFSSHKNLYDCMAYFKQIDEHIHTFLNRYQADFQSEIKVYKNGEMINLSPLNLFTHTITHEFHHKGQIMSLSRHLGYIPVDADIIR